MELGTIEISTKQSNCKLCNKIILKDRKRVVINSNYANHSTNLYYHIDCYLNMVKEHYKNVKLNIKVIKEFLTKEYLEQKQKDILVEAL